MNAGDLQKFTRMVQRKYQTWEKDSRARSEFDIQSQFPTVTLQPMWGGISYFVKRSQTQRMNVSIFESPGPHCGGSRENFPVYGRQKDFRSAWKKDTVNQQQQMERPPGFVARNLARPAEGSIQRDSTSRQY